MELSALLEIEAKLTGPGGPFEVVEAEVLGHKMRVMKNRSPSLRAMVEQSVAHGAKEYIVCEGRRITFEEHGKLVASVAKALSEEYGIGKGDRVAILAANRPEWIIAFWATVSLGGVAVAFNGWWSQDEILYGLEDAEPKLLVGDRKRLARLEGVDLSVPVVEMESDFPRLEAYDPGAALPATPIAEEDPAVILYTSGTTGRPKGAVNTHRNVCAFVSLIFFHGVRLMLVAAANGKQPDPDAPENCNLYNAPLFHLSGLYAGAVGMLAGGVKTVWMTGRFEPVKVLQLMQDEKVTAWAPLGSMGHRVSSHPDREKFDLSSVRTLGSGGAPTSKETQEELQKAFPTSKGNFGVGYGLSESTGSGTMNFGEFLAESPDSVGGAMPTVEVEIRDTDDNPVGVGEQGEICLRGPVVMLEYWRRPDATAETIDEGRWLRTGDIGHLDERGFLYINSRARDLILRDAENIYPVEVEQRIESHPQVAEAAVFGVDHPTLGQEVKAVVVTQPGAELGEGALADHCREVLAPYKVPAHWELREEPLPRNAAGKILKQVLSGETENALVEE
jgi:acyl-CoA synthetase (AMP-forming)/AMP-acid ligase II